MTHSDDTVSDPQDVGALAAAHVEPDPEKEHDRHRHHGHDGHNDPAVAGSDDDPARTANREDQPGHDSERSVSDPEEPQRGRAH